MGCDSQFDEPTKNDLKVGQLKRPGNPMWGMPSGSLVPEKGPRIQTSRFEYNDRTDSFYEVPMVTTLGGVPVEPSGTAKQTVEIIGFGDPVAQPGIYLWTDGHLKESPEKTQEPYQNTRPVLTAFEQDLRRLINRNSLENASNTPDSILAEYLSACLNAFNVATKQRETWYGRKVF